MSLDKVSKCGCYKLTAGVVIQIKRKPNQELEKYKKEEKENETKTHGAG